MALRSSRIVSASGTPPVSRPGRYCRACGRPLNQYNNTDAGVCYPCEDRYKRTTSDPGEPLETTFINLLREEYRRSRLEGRPTRFLSLYRHGARLGATSRPITNATLAATRVLEDEGYRVQHRRGQGYRLEEARG